MIIIISAIGACSPPKTTTPMVKRYYQMTRDVGYGLQVYEIDSCEYIGRLMPSDEGSTVMLGTDILTHKGNCRFCAHRKSTTNTKSTKVYAFSRSDIKYGRQNSDAVRTINALDAAGFMEYQDSIYLKFCLKPTR